MLSPVAYEDFYSSCDLGSASTLSILCTYFAYNSATHLTRYFSMQMHPSLPENSSASLSKGMWYVFHDGHNTIRAWGSGWTGLERVYFNDQILANCKHLKRVEQFAFERDGHRYRVECSNNNLQKWQVQCSFWKDEHQVCALKCKRRKILNVRPTFAHLMTGLLVGLIGGLLNMPAWFGVVFIFISLSLTLLTTAKSEDFIIEQDADPA